MILPIGLPPPLFRRGPLGRRARRQVLKVDIVITPKDTSPLAGSHLLIVLGKGGPYAVPSFTTGTFFEELEGNADMVLVPLLPPATLELGAGVVGFVHEGDGCAVYDGEVEDLGGRGVEDGMERGVHLERFWDAWVDGVVAVDTELEGRAI